LMFLAARLGKRVRLLWLATARPRVSAAFEQAFDVDRLEVKPLSEASMHTLGAAVLDHDDDVTLHARTFERARGSPLFLMHAMRSLVEGGVIQRADFGWLLRTNDDVDAQPLPSKVERLLGQRIQRLPEDARLMVCACASLGLTFLPSVAHNVGVRLGLSAEAVSRALQLLHETGFLARSMPRPGAPIFVDEESNAQDDVFFAFEHPLLRQTAAHMALVDEQQAIHAAIADAYESLLSGNAIAAALARHHQLGQRTLRAVIYFGLAATRALRLDDKAAARSYIEQALALADDRDHETQFSLWLDRCRILEGDPSLVEELKASLKPLLRHGQKLGPYAEGSALLRVARFNLFAGDTDKAEEVAARALQRARATASTSGSARHAQIHALRLMSLARFVGRDWAGAKRALEQARTLAEDPRALGVLEHQMGMILLESNDAMGALRHLLAAHQHKRRTGDLAGVGACLDTIADIYLRRGLPWTSLQLIDRAVHLRESIGDDAGMVQSLCHRAEVLTSIGDVAHAIDVAKLARSQAKALGLERVEHAATLAHARATLIHGDADATLQVLDGLRRRLDVDVHSFATMEMELVGGRAKWERALQSTGAARDRLLKAARVRAEQAVELGQRHGYGSGLVLGQALLADVLLLEGDVEGAFVHAQQAADWCDERTATALPIEDILGAYARVQQARHHHHEAHQAAARAQANLQRRCEDVPAEWHDRFWSPSSRRRLREGFAAPPASARVPA
jgi:predicted ATPase